jgi:hypothetical protein
MHNNERSDSIPYERRRCVEAAVLALVLAEDWPWCVGELAQRLRVPSDVIGLSTATLHADGLLVVDADELRASWAALRGDELLRCPPTGGTRSNVERCPPNHGAARLLPHRHRSGGNSAPNHPKEGPHESPHERIARAPLRP